MKAYKFKSGDKVKVRNIPALNEDHVWTIKYVLRDNNYLLVSSPGESGIEIIINAYDLTKEN